MSENPIKDFNQLARDTAYAAVGLGVLGFQKAQVRRRELTDAIAGHDGPLSEQVRAATESVRPQIDALRPQVEALRPQAAAVGTQLLAAAAAIRPQIEAMGASLADLLKAMDAHAAPVRHEVDVRISELEDRLPDGARSTVAHLRAAAVLREEALRRVVGLIIPDSPSQPAASQPDAAAPPEDEPPA